MESKEYLEKFEESIHQQLYAFLVSKDAVDAILPDATDILDKWENICMAYLPDGVREYQKYPTYSLGCMMYVGMAMAKFWDEDWNKYSQVEDLYVTIRDVRGFDNLDDSICTDFLGLDSKQIEQLHNLVSQAAGMVYNALSHEGFEPSTPDAFNAYVRCLHQLYYFGAALELKRLGYHMTPLL